MSAIFGIFQRDGSPVDPEKLASLQQSHQRWGPDGSQTWLGTGAAACCGLGQARFFTTPEAHAEHLPLFDPQRGLAFTAAGRVDNRSELMAALPALVAAWPQATLSDGDLMYLAYLHWGADAPQHIYGDWAFAAYHTAEQRLFIARDHLGNTALYYCCDAQTFAFASDRHALPALGLPPGEMDELYLAQVLISWPAYHGERTIFNRLKRLPPAHTLSVNPQQLAARQYWFLEKTPLLRLPNRQAYAEAFLEVFDRAVQAQLRQPAGAGPIASSLSGGLDSGAVTASAAKFLAQTGQTLDAYTSTPLYDTKAYVGQRFGDEWEYAQATAEYAGIRRHQAVDAAEIGVIASIRTMLAIQGEPMHAAGNQYWIIAMLRAAQAAGSRVFLTGQQGNAGISWAGSLFSQPLAYQIRQMGASKWAKEQLKRHLPPALLNAWQKQRAGFEQNCRASAIHPAFARRLDIFELRRQDPSEQLSPNPLALRSFLMPGRSLIGTIYAQMAAEIGLEVRDPTGDARLLAFTFSVPDWVFTDPQTGLERWLIRSAMQGRLPDSIRLNQKRGRQAGDLTLRLRAEAPQVEAALAELAAGPAAAYLDLAYMRQTWQLIQTQDTPAAFDKAIIVLTRGLMATVMPQ